jgi:hypothetical protein
MGTKGDSGTGTRQESTTEETHQPLPINTDDSAVTWRKGTAAREKWELFSTRRQQPQIFVKNAGIMHTSVCHPYRKK